MFSRALLFCVAGLLVAPPASAAAQPPEQVTVTAEAQIFRRPNTESEVRTTVPAGTVLEVLERQEGWVAVSAPDAIIGWIQESLTAPVAPTPAADPPADPPPSPRPDTPPPPARPATERAVPPPPPARPPSAGGAATSSQGGSPQTFGGNEGGLYGQGGWGRLAFSSTEGMHPGAELAWAKMLSPIVEFRNEISARRRSEGALPGIETLGAGSFSGDFATEEDPVWDMEISGALSFYLLQPSGDLPLGLHVGGFGDWTRYMGSIIPSVGEYQTIGYGGEVGGFYRSPKGNVVRVAVQVGQIRYSGDDDSVTESLVNLLVGVEPRIGPVQFGAWAGRQNGQTFLKAGFVFP